MNLAQIHGDVKSLSESRKDYLLTAILTHIEDCHKNGIKVDTKAILEEFEKVKAK